MARLPSHTGAVDVPEISVVVPTFRRPASLPELMAALEGQSLAPTRFEVLVVDNGSCDDTQGVLAQLAERSPLTLRVLEHTLTQGPAGARNAGWQAARAPLVAFTDDDCLPQPGWLAAGLDALRADARLGVIQGRTQRPTGGVAGEWSVYREIEGETPFFEGCNLFFRQEALAQTGGFDEILGLHFEDTAAGWAVVEAGWRRSYAADALVIHPVEARGFRWHVHNGLLERNMVRVATEHPGFRQDACWRPWAYQRDTVLLALAALGIVTSTWRPAALTLALPYAAHAVRSAGPRPRPGYVVERMVVDMARAVAHVRGSLENRTLLL